MRNPVPATPRSQRNSKLLAQIGTVALLAGLGAGCSTSAFQLNEPVFTGSTPNQQQILASQAAPYSAPTQSYASAPAYPAAQGSGIQRQELQAPSSNAYAPPMPTPQVASVQPYTPPKPFAAKGMPTPLGRVASAPSAASTPMRTAPAGAIAPMEVAQGSPPLPVRRGTPPRTLGEQAQAVAGVSNQAEVRVASVDPRAPLPAEMTQDVQAPLAEQPQAAAPAPQPEAAPAPAASAAEGFRWPVRGRVISGFGKKASGERNDGINLAVPEGTSVKAAEDGEVIYSGNELKSYGNLILVRHPNGWVSAYAHNSELKVKRGEKIRRGQIVALSGMSGGVTTPQVHFELRKDATPVDPISHLSEG